jgi:hypothetical protein
VDEPLGLALAAILSGSVAATVIGLLFQRRVTTIEEQIKNGFARSSTIFASHRSWKERSVAELLGPVYMQLERTERAFRRWEAHNVYLESKIIGEGNRAIRDLLMTKTFLVPPELRTDAALLVEHYDRWLEEFERIRGSSTPVPEQPFVFVGPKGFPFPRDAAERLQETFRRYWDELYASDAAVDAASMESRARP